MWGGVRTIFLTHRDDVADAHLYAKHFGAERIIHRQDAGAQKDAEIRKSRADADGSQDLDVSQATAMGSLVDGRPEDPDIIF